MAGPRPLRWLSRLNEIIARGSGVVVGALLVAMTAVVAAAVYSRYIRNASLTWADEATRYLAIWLVFLGVGLAHRWGQHVRIGILVERLPGRFRHAGELVIELVVLLLLLVIGWYGWQITMSNFDRMQISPGLRIRIAWIYLAVPVGLGLAALQSLERALWSLYALATGQDHPVIPFAQATDAVLETGAEQ